MRPRLSHVVSSQLQEIARIEGRSPTEVIGSLASAALREHRAQGHVPVESFVDEDGMGQISFVATRLSPGMLKSLHKFAVNDQRSISGALRKLIYEGLHSRGLAHAPTPVNVNA